MFFTSAPLNDYLNQELEAGNSIVEHGLGFGSVTLLILLRDRFRTPIPISEGLEYREIRDPHYWWAELEDTRTREVLACQ